jgi:hypothetical protein
MRRHLVSALVVGLIAITLGLSPVQATLIIGGPGDSGVGDCMPFGCSDASTYQQIFDSHLFSSPITIAGLSFYIRNFDNIDPITGGQIVPNTILPANYTITLAVTSLPVDGLDSTVENNLDPSTTLFSQTFFIGFLSGDVVDHFTIQTTPANYFAYDPSQGNLLMDIRTDSTDLSLTMYMDINSSSGGTFSSAFDSDPHPAGCPDGSPGITTGCVRLDTGLVTGFETPDDLTSIPEPATFLSGIAGVLAIALSQRLKVRKNRA